MKLAPFSRPLIFGDRSLRFLPGILCVFTVALIGGMSSLQAQNITWSNTGTNYNTGSNWVGGSAPSTTNNATFSGAAVTQPNLTANVTNQAVRFDSTASGYTLSADAGRSLTLTGTTVVSAQNTSGTNTISAPIIISASGTQTRTIGQAAGGELVLSGNISSTSTNLTLSLSASSGPATFTLSGSNSYIGNTALSANATLNINSSTAISSGALRLNGNANINNTSSAAIALTNNNIELAGGSLTFLGNSTASSLSFGTGTVTISGAASRTLNTTAGGTLTIGRLAADTTARGFTHGGTGTLVIQNFAKVGREGRNHKGDCGR